MDKVFIQGLKIDTTIGVYDWEKSIKQTLVFDLTLYTDIRAAAGQDDIQLTPDYAAISQRLIEFVQSTRFELIESVAEAVCQLLLSEYLLPKVTLRLCKPGAVAEADTVGVEITRSRD